MNSKKSNRFSPEVRERAVRMVQGGLKSEVQHLVKQVR